MPIFERSVEIDAPIERVFSWHERPGAFERLSPTWEQLRIVHQSPTIREGAEVRMQIRKGPLWLPWHAKHTAYEPPRLFEDIALAGPFPRWRHQHRFDSTPSGGTRLTDSIEWGLPLGPVGNFFGGWFARALLERMFRQRHIRTRNDINVHEGYVNHDTLTIAISGASGLIGTALTAFLTTGGQEVLRLVRREARSADEVEWDPSGGTIDAEKLRGVDAVVHLAGAGIADKRWTDSRKRLILESRVQGTKLIAEALAGLNDGPKVLISASAVGFYGDRGAEPVDEESGAGDNFLAEVCKQWESAAEAARDAGIRVVHPRIGVVLSGQGGALKKMLPPFLAGVGGKLGSGDQYMPWIAIDDVIGAIYFLIRHPEVSGPVNLVTESLPNAEFTKALGTAIRRPTIIPVPGFAIRTLFGEMGNQALLQGANVVPSTLRELGYEYQHRELVDAIRFELGKS